MLVDAQLQQAGVSREDVIADDLHPIPETVGERSPATPVLLAERVLQRDDRVALAEVGPVGDELIGGDLLGLMIEAIGIAVGADELACRGIERDAEVDARAVAGRSDRGDGQLERVLCGVELRGEAADLAWWRSCLRRLDGTLLCPTGRRPLGLGRVRLRGTCAGLVICPRQSTRRGIAKQEGLTVGELAEPPAQLLGTGDLDRTAQCVRG
jgi:hypothetical protein